MNFNKPWFYYSLAALFLVCFVDLGKKYVMDHKIITNPNHLVIYLSIFVGFFGLIHFFMDKSCKSPLECDYNLILHIFILAIIGYIFNDIKNFLYRSIFRNISNINNYIFINPILWLCF